jgi:hypothetical protein
MADWARSGPAISPKLILPLQIDLAIEVGRYPFGRSATPSHV